MMDFMLASRDTTRLRRLDQYLPYQKYELQPSTNILEIKVSLLCNITRDTIHLNTGLYKAQGTNSAYYRAS
jgi:hypothetical protein